MCWLVLAGAAPRVKDCVLEIFRTVAVGLFDTI
jgi:hypothetical protein